MEQGFTKASSANLPRIDLIMLGTFLASNKDFCSAEFRNVKTSIDLLYRFSQKSTEDFVWVRFKDNKAEMDVSNVKIHENNDTKTVYSILDILSWDCMSHILSFVPIKCLIKTETVSKEWRDMVNKHLQHRYTIFDTDWWPEGMSILQLQHLLSRLGPGLLEVKINGIEHSEADDFDLGTVDLNDNLCPKLKDLELEKSYLMYFSPLLFKLKKLKSVMFNRCKFTDKFTTEIIDYDTNIENLTVYNDLYFTGHFLAVNTPVNIRCLDFSHCSSLDSGHLHHLHNLPNLFSLKIDGQYSHKTLYIWADIPDIICRLTQLKELSLSKYFNYCVSEKMYLEYDDTRFCEALSKLKLLKHINFRENQFITNKVMEEIAKSCQELETLDVSECNGIKYSRRRLSPELEQVPVVLYKCSLLRKSLRDEGVLGVRTSCGCFFRGGVSEVGVAAVQASCKGLIELRAEGIVGNPYVHEDILWGHN